MHPRAHRLGRASGAGRTQRVQEVRVREVPGRQVGLRSRLRNDSSGHPRWGARHNQRDLGDGS